MKKIIYVFCSQNFGGAEIVLRRLVYFNKDNVLPVVLCPPGFFSDDLKKNNIKVVQIKSLGSLERGRRKFLNFFLPLIILKKFFCVNFFLFKELLGGAFAVHSNNLPATVYVLPTLLIARWIYWRKVQWVWSSHDMSYPNQLSFKLAEYCIKKFHKTLVVSEAVKRLYPGLQSKISVLYNGIDVGLFQENQESRKVFRERYRLLESSVVFAIIGKISKGKGHLILLEAFKKLLKSHPDAYLVIVGAFSTVEPNFEKEVREKIREVNHGRVLILAPIEGIQQVYNGIDILINSTSASLGESLGTTIYEAMSCKKVVIATKTGGSAEIVDDGKDGFLVSPDNPSELADKMCFAIENFTKLVSLREAARNKAVLKFNIEIMAENYNRILGVLE